MTNTTTTTKNVETRATQLEALMNFAKTNGFEGNMDKLEKVLTQWNTKREKSNTPSRTAIENEKLAKAVYEKMPLDEAVTNQQIMEMRVGIMTTNKAAVIMGKLIEAGLVSKCRVGKIMTYTRLK